MARVASGEAESNSSTFAQVYLRKIFGNVYANVPNTDRVTHYETLLICGLVRAVCPVYGTWATYSFRSGNFRGYGNQKSKTVSVVKSNKFKVKLLTVIDP